MQAQRGYFITLEGIEGTGKTTQMQVVCDRLQALGLSLDVTREPGGTALGESIRRVLLDRDNGEMDQDCELLLMFAARAQHLAQRIRPALAQGNWVVCDRFTDSSFAYQGGGRGMSMERIEVLARWTHANLQPDLTLLLDGDPRAAMARLGRRGERDRFELEAEAFFERARATFLARAQAHPARFRVIPAIDDLAVVSAAVTEAVDDFVARIGLAPPAVGPA